ncbi:tyrosine-type recombinase/integrase [Cellulomonas sp. Y8]|uniref:tyrosine-type recombinase/integrase n=1 Tax=Cellulomonas sp. Y8 TaxID=2591145 RepID=UPI001FEFBC08|nr:tyrosine-type recombinase/integrase [Cellulomonas sp. Y8]
MTTTTMPYACICGGQALQRWLAHMDMANNSPKTINERARIVRAAATSTGLPSCRLTADAMMEWLRLMREPGSRATYYNALRAWSVFLVRQGYREDDPTLLVPRPKLPRAAPRSLPDEAVHRAIAAAGLQLQAKMLLGAVAGFRPGEVAKVRTRDFRQAEGMVEVVGKGGVRDYVPVAPGLAELVELMPARGPWFPSSLDPRRPMTSNSLSASVSRGFRRVGAEGTAHRLRHWFASTMLAEGVDVRVVQELLRHRSLATTARYTAVGQQRRVDAIATLPLLRPTARVSARTNSNSMGLAA